MARVVAVFDDLLLGSNTLGMLQAAGHDARLAGAAAADPRGADVLIADLAAGTFDGVELIARLRGDGWLDGVATIGVYSHVDAATRERAVDAGLDLVVPRSRMAREGAALVAQVLGSRGA
jgi:DNA-binding NarL/FixJ family response regulator